MAKEGKSINYLPGLACKMLYGQATCQALFAALVFTRAEETGPGANTQQDRFADPNPTSGGENYDVNESQPRE